MRGFCFNTARGSKRNRMRYADVNARLTAFVLVLLATFAARAQGQLAQYVNPFLGTAPLTDPKEIGFKPP
jgi:hypothetical protein